MALTKVRLRIQTVLTVHVREGISLVRNMATCTVRNGVQALVRHSHVHQSLIVVSAIVVDLFTLQLVLDTFAVRRVPNEGKNRSDPFHQQSTLTWLGIIQRSLHAVVAIGVPQKLFKTSAVQQFIDQHFTSGVLCDAYALTMYSTLISHKKDETNLLDNIRTELLNRKRAYVTSKLTNDSVTESIVVQVQNILHHLKIVSAPILLYEGFTHIITVRILDECESIIRNLVNQLDALVIRCMIDASLQDATSMTMRSDLYTVSSHRVVNELDTAFSRNVSVAEMIRSPDYLRAPAYSSTFE